MYLMRMKPTSPIRMYSCLMSFTPSPKRRFTGIVLPSCEFVRIRQSIVSVYGGVYEKSIVHSVVDTGTGCKSQ